MRKSRQLPKLSKWRFIREINDGQITTYELDDRERFVHKPEKLKPRNLPLLVTQLKNELGSNPNVPKPSQAIDENLSKQDNIINNTNTTNGNTSISTNTNDSANTNQPSNTSQQDISIFDLLEVTENENNNLENILCGDENDYSQSPFDFFADDILEDNNGNADQSSFSFTYDNYLN